MPTPANTAYCNGMTIVSAKVTARTTFCTVPVRHTDWRSAGLIVRTPMRISRPASAGMARCPTADPNATITTAITTPANTAAWRDRAPAALFRAEADTEPPTGMPWNTPDAMLATPCPTKSRDASG